MTDSRMPLTDHLSELRKRISISLTAALVLFAFTFNYSKELFDILIFPLNTELKISLAAPYLTILRKPPTSLVFLAPAEAFWMHMKLAFIASLILSLPVLFHQFWKFISPGLLPREKKYLLPFIFFASALFSIGVLFCFFVVLPFAMTFLLGYRTESMQPMLSVGSYIDFCLKFILAFGVIFELPLIIVFLTRFGIVSPAALSRHRKYAVLVAFMLAAVLTPTPDAFNQVLMAIPIIILYEAGILISRLLYRKKLHG